MPGSSAHTRGRQPTRRLRRQADSVPVLPQPRELLMVFRESVAPGWRGCEAWLTGQTLPRKYAGDLQSCRNSRRGCFDVFCVSLTTVPATASARPEHPSDKENDQGTPATVRKSVHCHDTWQLFLSHPHAAKTQTAPIIYSKRCRRAMGTFGTR